MGINLVVVGAASNYTPELFTDLAEFRERLDVEQVRLVDLNSEKLTFVANVCQRLIDAKNLNIQIVTTPNLQSALPGADFILAQIRVGGLAARVRDETLPMELDMVGNETTGAGGFVCALRTVPVMLNIARTVERLAPKAWIMNMSNPAGIVTEAILKYTGVKALGFCNIPINTQYHFAEVFGVDPARIQLDSFGLNHLSWVRRVLVDGLDRLQPLIDQLGDRSSILYQHGFVEDYLAPELLRGIRMVPSWYVRFFYYPEIVLEDDRKQEYTKGSSDMQAEEDLRMIYAAEGYTSRAQQILADKGGAQYYLPVLQAIESVVYDRGDSIILDTLNQGSIPDLPPGVCVEVPSRVYRERVDPLPIGSLPLPVRGLVQTVKAYEELTIEAALTGSTQKAIAALMANPLVGTYPKASHFIRRVIENERETIALSD